MLRFVTLLPYTGNKHEYIYLLYSSDCKWDIEARRRYFTTTDSENVEAMKPLASIDAR